MADLAGYYPNSPAPLSIDMRTITPSTTTNTFSGKTLRLAYGGQYYEADLRYPNMKSSEARSLFGFLAQTYGPTFSFEVIFPEISITSSTNPPTTTVRTNGAVSRGVKQVTLENCGANKRVLNGGDYFKFDNHSKVYQATNDCDSDGSGAATLFFAGSCVADVPDNTDLTLTLVPFTMILAENTNSYNIGTGGVTGRLTVKMREVF
jgi:hypothetical protein